MNLPKHPQRPAPRRRSRAPALLLILCVALASPLSACARHDGPAVLDHSSEGAGIKFDAQIIPAAAVSPNDLIALGVYLGLFAAFLIMAVSFLVADRGAPLPERLIMAFYAAAAIFFVAASSGLGWRLLWPGNAFLEKRMTILCACAIVFLAIWLVRNTLALKRRARAFDVALLALQAALPPAMAGVLVLDLRAAASAAWFLLMASMIAIFAACLYGALKRWRRAFFLLPAFAAFFLGEAASMGLALGAPGPVDWIKPEYLGLAIQICILSIERRDAFGARLGDELQAARLGRVVLAEVSRKDAKAGFFSALSHEIKNPIALLDASLQALGRGEYGASVPVSHAAFALMRKNLHRLERLVDGALDVIEVEEGKREALPEPVDLAAGLSLYAAEFDSAFAAKEVSLSTEAGAGVYGLVDRRHFEIIAFNLVANALRRSSEGGTVSLRLRRDGAASCLLEVSDSGPRIDAAQRESIFDLYRTSFDGSRTGNEDTFIGLCQARQLARLNGGELSLGEPRGLGETFVLRLGLTESRPSARDIALAEPGDEKPAAYRFEPDDGGIRRAGVEALHARGQDAAPEPETVYRKRGSGGERRILVVEDAPELLDFLAEALGKDFTVATAGNGAEALTAMKSGWIPDLVVSDIMMPIMDGPALLSRMKEDVRLASVPLIFLTARNQAEDRVKSFRDGAVAYIAKPFFYEELKAAVDNILALRESGMQAAERRIIEAIHGRREGPGEQRGPAINETMDAFGFTKQEREVAIQLATGKSDKEIASTLVLSPRTVSNYVGRMLKKAGVSSRTELTVRLNN
jgi:DNA-binding NarL/FixJ family response regulator/signal transduction histidine kinase